MNSIFVIGIGRIGLDLLKTQAVASLVFPGIYLYAREAYY